MKEFSESLLELLKTKYDGLNLTRITDPEDFYQKQILDSVCAYEQSKTFAKSIIRHKHHIDIGFGGGFPLLPMAKILPGITFLGFEARAKKVRAVNGIAKELELRNVNCFHQRYESVNYDRPVSMTFKAVGPIKKILDGFISFQHLDVFFYKGPQVFELEGVATEYNGWRLLCSDEIKVPGTEARYLIGYTKKNVPRGTKSNKELVNLTALV
jgi:16S rRNA (guanine527-N7)-methyltransferase